MRFVESIKMSDVSSSFVASAFVGFRQVDASPVWDIARSNLDGKSEIRVGSDMNCRHEPRGLGGRPVALQDAVEGELRIQAESETREPCELGGFPYRLLHEGRLAKWLAKSKPVTSSPVVIPD